jgi:hypothetical protein
VAVDPVTNDVYITEGPYVRRVSAADGNITTWAFSDGNPDLLSYNLPFTAGKDYSYGDGGPASLARAASLVGVAATPAGVYVADMQYSRVRFVDRATMTVKTVLGNGVAGLHLAPNPADVQMVAGPGALLPAAGGDGVFVATTGASNTRILFLNTSVPRGNVSVVAGSGAAGYTGAGPTSALAARIGLRPISMALDPLDPSVLYFADPDNNAVRKLVLQPAAGGGAAATVRTLQTSYALSLVVAVASHSSFPGLLFVLEQNASAVAVVNLTTGATRRVAGTYVNGCTGSPATKASLGGARSVAVGPNGDYFLSRVNYVPTDDPRAGASNSYAIGSLYRIDRDTGALEEFAATPFLGVSLTSDLFAGQYLPKMSDVEFMTEGDSAGELFFAIDGGNAARTHNLTGILAANGA